MGADILPWLRTQLQGYFTCDFLNLLGSDVSECSDNSAEKNYTRKRDYENKKNEIFLSSQDKPLTEICTNFNSKCIVQF